MRKQVEFVGNVPSSLKRGYLIEDIGVNEMTGGENGEELL